MNQFTALLALLTLSLSTRALEKVEQTPSEDLAVRIDPQRGMLIISRMDRIIAAALIRRMATADDSQPLVPNESWRKLKPLSEGKEIVQSLPWKWDTGDRSEGTFLLRARKVSSGVRVLISPQKSGLLDKPQSWNPKPVLPGDPQPAQPTLELALEFPSQFKLKTWGVEGTLTSPPGGPPPILDGKQGLRAIRLSFEGEKESRIEIARSAPAIWTLLEKDSRLLLRHPLYAHARYPTQPAEFEFYLGEKWDGGPPEISPIELNKKVTPTGNFIEGAVRVYAGGADPYGYELLSVFAEVAFPPTPSSTEEKSRVAMLPCFFRESPTYNLAEGEFRFRFAPPLPGTYGVRIIAIARSLTVRSNAVAFQAEPSTSPGNVRVRKHERVFRTDDGNIFMPVGLNLAWPDRKNDSLIYRQRFRALAKNGGNAGRIWLSSWGLPLEQTQGGRFDPEVAEALDDIFLQAQIRDIRLILVAENAHDLTEKSALHPYFEEKGGPLTASAQFFRNPDAIKLFKRRLTYLSARYGAYSSLFAWELLNEADEVWPILKTDPDDPKTAAEDADLARAARRRVLDWVTLVGSHLQAMDPQHHPIAMSLALDPAHPWKELEDHNQLAFIEAHGYVPKAEEAKSDDAFDSAELISAWLKASRSVGRARRPYLLGEFGYWTDPTPDPLTTKSSGPKTRNEQDSTGLLLHNALMSGLAAGGAGSPMLWWWDSYVERHDLWKCFKGPSFFAAALSRLGTRDRPGTLRALDNREEQAAVRVIGRAGKSGMCLWIHDKRSTWSRELEQHLKPPDIIRDLDLRLPSPQPGTYALIWLDTRSGTTESGDPLVIKGAAEIPADETFSVRCPAFLRDIGLIIEPALTGASGEP